MRKRNSKPIGSRGLSADDAAFSRLARRRANAIRRLAPALVSPQAFRAAEQVTVAGCGHVPQVERPCDLAWTSVTGLDHRGRWRLREAPGGRTRVEFRLAYVVAGAGPERLAGRADRGTHRDPAREPDPAAA
jgi:hypothetical protein